MSDRIHRARKPRRCHDGSHPHMIAVGDLYRSTTIYPGDDLLGADTPYRLRQCTDCATRHGRDLAAIRGGEHV
ncbi:hypothetical protein [Stackebrandtia soli]|uniref:hypothetical protein n=1 Tax=Stackebrandtia soli TaxID=1892856 RepID=UPI0039ED30B5